MAAAWRQLRRVRAAYAARPVGSSRSGTQVRSEPHPDCPDPHCVPDQRLRRVVPDSGPFSGRYDCVRSAAGYCLTDELAADDSAGAVEVEADHVFNHVLHIVRE